MKYVNRSIRLQNYIVKSQVYPNGIMGCACQFTATPLLGSLFSTETRSENKSDTNKFKRNSINKRNRDCR